MTAYEFIFSKKIAIRIARHLVFWGMYYVYSIINNLPGISGSVFLNPQLYSDAFRIAILYLPVYLFSVYVSLYFILPVYMAKRSFLFLAISFFVVLIITFSSGYIISKVFIFEKSNWRWDVLDVITLALKKCISEQMIITGSAIILKIIKDYYLKQQENEKLSIQKINHQLEMMKMRMQPQIFLGCLKDIYEDINCGYVYAPEMILKLSDLLSYILYEGELKQVPVKKEINMILDYLGLKKLTYKDKLDIRFETSGEMNTCVVTPLLFLPFLEMPFAAQVESFDKAFVIDISIKMVESTLYFSLKTNIPNSQLVKNNVTSSILDDVRKKLEIIYFRRHKMYFDCYADGFTITLEVILNPNTERLNKHLADGRSLNYEYV